ncbi:MAG: ligand-binding sensor domain-containing protein [Flavobacteriales bacterium]
MFKKLLLFVWIALIPSACAAQSYKIKAYSDRDGLSSAYINTINQDSRGYLLIGTSEGLFRYDGFRFQSYTTKDSLADNFIECSLSATNDRILFGHNNGNVSIYQNGTFDILHLEKFLTSKIVQILQDKEGNFYLISQSSGICILDKGFNILHVQQGLEDYNVFTAQFDSNNRLWLGTDLGIVQVKFNGSSKCEASIISGFPITTVTGITNTQNNRLLVSTIDAGLYSLDVASSAIDSIKAFNEDLSAYQIKNVREDKNGVLWIATNNAGLIELSNPQKFNYQTVVHFTDGALKDVISTRTSFTDREGNVWIGSIGNGLLKLEDDYFSTFKITSDEDLSIYSLYNIRDSLYIGGNGYIQLCFGNPRNIIDTFGKEKGLPNTPITAIYRTSKGDLYAGTIDDGLWKLPANQKRFKRILLSTDFKNQKISHLLFHDGMLYVATDFGAYILENDKLNARLSIETGLSGNVVRSFFKDSKNRIWIGTTSSEISFIDTDGSLQILSSPIPNSTLPVRFFAEDAQRNIWMSTEGAGVMKLSEDGFKIFQKEKGLYSDFCYSMASDDKNHLWIGHRGALSRININTDEITILSPGEIGDISCTENAILRLSSGMIYFGTNNGLLRYDPIRDKKNELEPLLNFNAILVGDSTYTDISFIDLPYGDYKVAFDFVGISLKQSEGVSYQYILDGYDTEWSEFTKDHVITYNHLGPGTYTFKVKAFNADGFGGKTVREFTLTIDSPFWQKWWFILGAIILFLVTGRLVLLRRERILKANQEYLKKELAARTKEVVEQKELLEIKNKDITDSILYAKNIQNAFLPSYLELKAVFSDAFVYFKPRDIVSGDFYWVQKTDRYIQIACGDCTGHGVPGAFMSLIGSRVLKDVSALEAPNNPAHFLSCVDQELSQVFKQGSEASTLNDGMDMALVSFDTFSGVARFASANRPIFVYHQNKIIEIKGDRRPLGGTFSAMVTAGFTGEELTLHKGDIIYLFSDGITDQFGGPYGKKIKKRGFKSWIQEVCQLPLDVQRNAIKEKFKAWRGDLDQLDDIIIIAIQI